jgi:hypothetical protein
MDKTLEECEREIYKEYQAKVNQLNEREDSDTRYQLTHIRGRDLKVRLIREGGKTQQIVCLDYIDKKLSGMKPSVSSEDRAAGELNEVLVDLIQLINKFRHHWKILK